MLSEQVKNELKISEKSITLFNEPMKNYTSFGIGGPADALIIPSCEDDIEHALRIASQNSIPITIIGNGTNLLISDEGIEGIVIRIADCLDYIVLSGLNVKVGAGCPLSRLSRLVADQGLTGIEFAIGIPGTVGGAVITNAGAHGASVGDVITKIRVMNHNYESFELEKEKLHFSYRKSSLQKKDLIVLDIEMKLKEGNIEEIKRKMQEYLQQRRKKQPSGLRSAGSIFKNPKGDYAGRLIEACGCKGINIGDAQISELHANFIVNKGNSTSRDIVRLMNKVQKIVSEKHGVKLEPEIDIKGREASEIE